MKIFGLIGKSLKHSFSKDYFNRRFKDEKRFDCLYKNFELPSIDQLPQLIEQNPDLLGLNITIPYKEQIIKFLDNISDEAAKIGAVNTVTISRSNGTTKLTGYNTDIYGIEQTLLSLPFHPPQALVLGTGGAAKAVVFVLKKMNINYKLVSRHHSKADYTYNTLTDKHIQNHLLIINTTPLGMFPHTSEHPLLPYNALTSKHILFDLIYNPPLTKFLQLGKAKGATVINGYKMLIKQAEQNYNIFCENN